jgi:iron complex outermembrane receptor protein
LARWDHTLAGGSQTSFQTYYDTYHRTDLVPESLKTFDFDFQHHIAAGDRNDVVWGLGYRASSSEFQPGGVAAFTPPSKTDNLFSAFLQDEIRVSNSLWLTLGCKLEHNSYTGVETEPSVRLVWTPPASRYTIWAAASKAIRQPARSDTDVRVDLETLPVSPGMVKVLRLFGNPHIKSEELRDYEVGYRSDFTKTLSLDVATFLSFYRHLETIQPQAIVVIPGAPSKIEIPLLNENNAHALNYGGEVSLNWTASSRWRVSPGYSFLHATIRQDATSQDWGSSGTFPQNIFQIRSQVNLSRNMAFDQALYYTARLPGGRVPSQSRFDLRLARWLGESAEISLVGQNLLRPRAVEYGDSDGIVGTQVQRSVFGSISWRF